MNTTAMVQKQVHLRHIVYYHLNYGYSSDGFVGNWGGLVEGGLVESRMARISENVPPTDIPVKNMSLATFLVDWIDAHKQLNGVLGERIRTRQSIINCHQKFQNALARAEGKSVASHQQRKLMTFAGGITRFGNDNRRTIHLF